MVEPRSPPPKTRATRNQNKNKQDVDDPTRSPSKVPKAATSMAATANTNANNNNNAALLPNATTASNNANQKSNTALLPDATTASDGVNNIYNTTLRLDDLDVNNNADTGTTIAGLTYNAATQGSAITQSADKSEAPILDETDKNDDKPMVRISSKRCIHYSDDKYKLFILFITSISNIEYDAHDYITLNTCFIELVMTLISNIEKDYRRDYRQS